MLRPLVKTGVADALHRTGADALLGRLSRGRDVPLVICYHRVVSDFAASSRRAVPAMLVSTEMLERQLDWIGRRFRFVSLEEVASQLERGQAPGRSVAAVTFDDGYADVYHHAFPLLQRKGIPAGIFVVTTLLGTEAAPIADRLHVLLLRAFSAWPSGPSHLAGLLAQLGVWPALASAAAQIPVRAAGAMRWLLDRLPHAALERVVQALESEFEIEPNVREEMRPLGWEMLSEMHRAGMTIGSHTRTHALLTSENGQKVADETAGSRRELERRLGATISHFAYPNGWFNASTVRAVAASGYRVGYTTCRHRDPTHPWLTVPRTLLWESSSLDARGKFSPAIMSCHAHGLFDVVTRCRQHHEA